jgi:hypothetical protein
MVFIEMNAAQNQRGLYAQRFDAAGQRLWGTGGTVLMPQNTELQSLPRLVLLDGAVVGTVLHNPSGLFGDVTILGYRIDATGGHAWGGTVPVASTPSGKGSPRLLASTSTTVAVWRDERAGNPDIYGQNLNPDGTLGQPTVSVSDDPAGPPAVVPSPRVVVHPAYPNPFNPSTTIAFELPQEARVSLRIVDVAGRLVRELVQGDLPAGTHRVTWNGTDQQGRPQASGVYLCQLVTPGQVATRSLTLVQ